VFFGAIAFGGARAASMLAQPAAPDQMAGLVGVALIVLAVVGVVAGRREAQGGGVLPVGEGL
jgi:hypothetical protein